MTRNSKTRVALVYPPYGPLNLPNLGLALLSAGVKRRGFECRTFYWNFRFMQALPETTQRQKQAIYQLMTQRCFSPWNEWLFTRSVFQTELSKGDAEVLTRLARLDRQMKPYDGRLKPSELIVADLTNEIFVRMTRSFEVVAA